MGYLALTVSALAYAIGIVTQTVAVRREKPRDNLDIGLVARLVTDRLYRLGFTAQVIGFAAAFAARGTLPLYLVQAGASSSVALAALLGAVVLGWPVRRTELAVLVVLAAGLVLLVGAAVPTTSRDVPPSLAFGLLGLLGVVAALAALATRLLEELAGIALGALAGLAFAVLAVASRPLAAGSLLALPLRPLAWLTVFAAVLGQVLLAAALQRGSITAATAAMDATTVVLSSAVGLAVLGDQVAPGRLSWVVAGLLLVLGGVVAMAVTQSRSTPAYPRITVDKEAVTP